MLWLSLIALALPLASAFRATRPYLSYADTDSTQNCQLAAILLVAVPGLHANHLKSLPLTLAAYDAAERAHHFTAHFDYLPQNQLEPIDRTVPDYFTHCTATLATPSDHTVQIHVFDRLQYALSQDQPALLADIDATIALKTQSLPSPYLVILTAPPHHSTPSSNLHFQSKRQLYDDDAEQAELIKDYSAYLLPDSASAIAEHSDDYATASESVSQQQKKPKHSGNIFTPDPKSGLLHRYVFFTPALTFSLLVTFLIFVPIIVLSTSGISSISTVAGLEGKMTGTVGLDPAKA